MTSRFFWEQIEFILTYMRAREVCSYWLDVLLIFKDEKKNGFLFCLFDFYGYDEGVPTRLYSCFFVAFSKIEFWLQKQYNDRTTERPNTPLYLNDTNNYNNTNNNACFIVYGRIRPVLKIQRATDTNGSLRIICDSIRNAITAVSHRCNII